jgi:hypothetical protein
MPSLWEIRSRCHLMIPFRFALRLYRNGDIELLGPALSTVSRHHANRHGRCPRSRVPRGVAAASRSGQGDQQQDRRQPSTMFSSESSQQNGAEDAYGQASQRQTADRNGERARSHKRRRGCADRQGGRSRALCPSKSIRLG